MAPNKRKKTSGLTGLELRLAHNSLENLMLVTTTDEASAESGNLITLEPDFEDLLKKILQMMKSKLDEPQALSFSGVSDEDLRKSNITGNGVLKMKEDYEERVAATVKLGKNEHWSSDGLYRHLCVLQKLVPKANEASSRIWIDSFFFRASAMVPQGKQLVLSLEHYVPPTAVKLNSSTTFGGYFDFTAITSSTSLLAGADLLSILRHQGFPQKLDHTLFVSEAKARTLNLEGNVPQAVSEMYACAKQRGRDFIRGTVTDGHDWIFLVLKMNSNGDGAQYAQSQPICLMNTVPPGDKKEVSRTMCNVIAGIISYWIGHSNEDIGDDDWFCLNIRYSVGRSKQTSEGPEICNLILPFIFFGIATLPKLQFRFLFHMNHILNIFFGNIPNMIPSRKSLVYLRFLSITSSSYYVCCILSLSITVIHGWTLCPGNLRFGFFWASTQGFFQTIPQLMQITTMTSTAI